MNNALFNSNNQTWETPIQLFDELNLLFNFQVDVCAFLKQLNVKNIIHLK